MTQTTGKPKGIVWDMLQDSGFSQRRCCKKENMIQTVSAHLTETFQKPSKHFKGPAVQHTGPLKSSKSGWNTSKYCSYLHITHSVPQPCQKKSVLHDCGVWQTGKLNFFFVGIETGSNTEYSVCLLLDAKMDGCLSLTAASRRGEVLC